VPGCFGFEVLVRHGAARLGRLWTAHGEVETPVFMPVGTQGTVKALLPEQVRAAGHGIIMANTYLSSDRCRTLPFSVIKFIGYYTADYATQFACMMLVALPILIVYGFLNRYITEGVTMGALRG